MLDHFRLRPERRLDRRRSRTNGVARGRHPAVLALLASRRRRRAERREGLRYLTRISEEMGLGEVEIDLTRFERLPYPHSGG